MSEKNKIKFFLDEKLSKPMDKDDKGNLRKRFKRGMTGAEDLVESIFIHNPTKFDFTISEVIVPDGVKANLKANDMLKAYEVRQVDLIWVATKKENPLSVSLGIRGNFLIYPDDWF